MPKNLTWKERIGEIVARLPRDFRLRDVLAYHDDLQREFPNNRFIDAKIRQSLQVLRDQGTLEFLGAGRYRRLDVAPKFSPFIDFSAAAEYISKSQIARIALETWACLNLYCLACDNDSLNELPANTKVSDLQCLKCRNFYQVKAHNGRYGSRIPGGEYKTTLGAVEIGKMPDLVLIEYDRRFDIAVFVKAIPGKTIAPKCIIARKPLKVGARRQGWQGCNIDVEDLPSVHLVAPQGREREDTRAEWRAL